MFTLQYSFVHIVLSIAQLLNAELSLNFTDAIGCAPIFEQNAGECCRLATIRKVDWINDYVSVRLFLSSIECLLNDIDSLGRQMLNDFNYLFLITE